MEKINVCIEFNETSVLKRWHNPVFTDNFFKNQNYKFVEFNDFNPKQKNFLFLYLVPAETLIFLKSMSGEFWMWLKKHNVKILFFNEQFNIFMREGDIFQTHKNLPNGKLDINGYLYWQVVKLCESNGVKESDLYFIHTAKGFVEEVQQMKHTVIPWIGTPLDIPSKHIHVNDTLCWGKRTKVDVRQKITYPYLCLFAGRPSSHRHDLIKNLWEEKLTKHGKISLTQMPDDTTFANVKFPVIGDGPNQHFRKDYDETKVFEDVFLCVVGETYVPNGYAYFTEKTIKPLMYEKPFLSYGNVGTLQNLRDHGFKTFGEFWDESYDLEKNDRRKIQLITKIIRDLVQKDPKQLQELYNDMRSIIVHNKRILMQTDWHKPLVEFLS